MNDLDGIAQYAPEAAVAVILLLLLWILARLGRIIRLLEGKSEARARADSRPAAEPESRYMREDTLAEFLTRQEQQKR